MQIKFLYELEIWGIIWTITGVISGLKKKNVFYTSLIILVSYFYEKQNIFYNS